MKVSEENEIVSTYARGLKDGIQKTLKRLWTVLIRDGEQFIAGEIRKIAEENGIEVDK